MQPVVRQALSRLDVRIMKLDAGTQEVLDRINRPAEGILIEDIVEGLRLMDDVTLQSVFVTGQVGNIGEDEITAWVDRVSKIGPKEVQVYSLENAPAMSDLNGVDPARLEEIAERIRRLGIEAKAY
jgi:wyosine [tRNA(Phe)-imidazoG37] synthetase (radical SAM superfamily)